MALMYLEQLLHRVRFRLRMIAFALTVKPVMGADDEDKADDDSSDADADDSDASDDGADDSDSDSDKNDSGDSEDDSDSDEEDEEEEDHKRPAFLRRAARKHQRRAQNAERKAARLQAEVDRLKNGGKPKDSSKDEKNEVEAAKQSLEAERRSFRLEQAVTRVARKGIKVGDGRDAKTLKFQDPDDALVHAERAISKGEINEDDIFDSDGKVKPDALRDFLEELLEERPHLQAGKTRPKGGAADARKGDSTKELESMTPADHAKRKYGDQKNEPVPPPVAGRR